MFCTTKHHTTLTLTYFLLLCVVSQWASPQLKWISGSDNVLFIGTIRPSGVASISISWLQEINTGWNWISLYCVYCISHLFKSNQLTTRKSLWHVTNKVCAGSHTYMAGWVECLFLKAKLQPAGQGEGGEIKHISTAHFFLLSSFLFTLSFMLVLQTISVASSPYSVFILSIQVNQSPSSVYFSLFFISPGGVDSKARYSVLDGWCCVSKKKNLWL